MGNFMYGSSKGYERLVGCGGDRGGSRILERGGASGVGDKLALLCFCFVPSFSFFTYILSMKGGACAPHPAPPDPRLGDAF